MKKNLTCRFWAWGNNTIERNFIWCLGSWDEKAVCVDENASLDQQWSIKDIYACFIESLILKKYASKVKLYKHHVLPRHQKGNNAKRNFVICSHHDPILAHYYRHMAYGNAWDILAARFMSKQTEDFCHAMDKIVGKMRAEQTERNGTHFFSPVWQKKYGDRNGENETLKAAT